MSQSKPAGVVSLRRVRIGLLGIAAAGLALVVLWGALVLLKTPLAQADLLGVVALLGICALGALAYGALGALLGVVNFSELRLAMRRQPGLKSADPDEPQ